MNIAIFVDAYLPVKNGVVTSVSQLKAGMEQAGHKVYILTTYHPDAQPLPDVVRFPAVKYGSKSENYLGIVSGRKVSKFIVEHKIDLLHSHTEFSLGMAAKKAARRHNLPLVHTNHTLWTYYKHYIPKWLDLFVKEETLYRMFQGKIRYFISPSVKALNFYKPFSRPDALFRIIPNGVDQSKFQTAVPQAEDLEALRTQLGLKRGDHVIVFAGRVGPEKRIVELVKALGPLVKRREDIKFLVIGDGPSRAELLDLVAREGWEGRVLLPGFIPWNQMYLYYALGQIFATASISEVHPMTLIEAAIAGLPSVTRDDDAYKPLLQEGVNGHLAPTDEDMARLIEGLLDDPDRLAQYSKAIRATADEYTADVHFRNVLAYYQFILEDFRRQPH